MRHTIVFFLCLSLGFTASCSPADITTRQGISANSLQTVHPLEFVTSPQTVKGGDIAKVTIKAPPNSLCTIAVHLSSGVSKAKGLEPSESDENGLVTWTWKISKQTKPGKYRITVTCGSLMADTYFTIE